MANDPYGYHAFYYQLKNWGCSAEVIIPLDFRQFEKHGESDDSRLFLHYADGRVRVWHKQYDPVDTSSVLLTLRVGDDTVVMSHENIHMCS